jgi:hypothetical protein
MDAPTEQNMNLTDVDEYRRHVDFSKEFCFYGRGTGLISSV